MEPEGLDELQIVQLFDALGDRVGARLPDYELEAALLYAAESVRLRANLRELLAAACIAAGDAEAAERYITELGSERHAIQSPRARPRLLESAAKVAAARERWADAAGLLGAAESYRQLVGPSGTRTSSRLSHDASTRLAPRSAKATSPLRSKTASALGA